MGYFTLFFVWFIVVSIIVLTSSSVRLVLWAQLVSIIAIPSTFLVTSFSGLDGGEFGGIIILPVLVVFALVLLFSSIKGKVLSDKKIKELTALNQPVPKSVHVLKTLSRLSLFSFISVMPSLFLKGLLLDRVAQPFQNFGFLIIFIAVVSVLMSLSSKKVK